jgi:hypothetical protein
MSDQTISITKLVNNRNDGMSEEERAALKKKLAKALQALSASDDAAPLPRANRRGAARIRGTRWA